MPDSAPASVVAFAGHMIDRADRPEPRFPAEAEGAVAEAIAQYLDPRGAVLGVCSLACGADILFAEAVLARGGMLHIILPVAVEDFLAESVTITDDPSWEKRFHAVREKAERFDIFGDAYLTGSGTPFQAAMLLIDGWSRHHAARLGVEGTALAVWDGKAGDGYGGTASFVGHAVLQGRDTTCIAPLDGNTFTPGAAAIRAASKHSWHKLSNEDQLLEHRLCAILFADAKGFSSLTELQVPAYVHAILGAVDRAVSLAGTQPRVVNTWGDGLFAIYDEMSDAANLALNLIAEAEKLDFDALGFNEPLTFRVALHAGPAFIVRDPVTGRPNAFGYDISRAARLEPVTEPGCAYASPAFVGFSCATGDSNLRFTSKGMHTLPKGAGEIELYEVSSEG